jgi:SNF2 family DNA or RNA helicase
MPQKKSFRSYNEYDDEEPIDEEPSSEEAEFTDESETSEEGLSADMQEDSIIADAARRTANRERERANASKNDSELENEEEENIYELPPTVEESKIERIYVSRVGKEDIEYLVRFQDAKDCLSQWVPEYLLQCLENSNFHLNRFRQNQVDITGDDSRDIVPIAYRKNGSLNELLYRFTFDKDVLLFWDSADDEEIQKFVKSRHRVDVSEPPVPPAYLQDPTEDVVGKGGIKLSQLQIDGVKWLIQCLRENHGAILADENSLNKQLEVLAYLQFLVNNTDWKGPFLLIVKPNSFNQWRKMLQENTDLAFVTYSSGPEQRKIFRDYQFPFLDEQGSPIPNTFSFNVLLVNYDIYNEDSEFLNDIKWECLIVDDEHFIKNNSDAMNVVLSRQRIILSENPVQNTLKDLWRLLNYISPIDFKENATYIQGDLESLTREQLYELRDKISHHVLRRTVSNYERIVHPNDESIAFVSLSNIQRDLIRLIKLHSMWRLKGIQVDQPTINPEQEAEAIERACNHPFLLEGAEEFYTKRLGLQRIDLLSNISTKFIWISNILKEQKQKNHKVIIFSNKIQLLHLICEFCILNGYKTELLTTDVSEGEKAEIIDRYSKNPDSFIFLISTKICSEGLNLSCADTAIILDAEWNPHNNFQASDERKRVSIFRLITYQTTEHQNFVSSQKKQKLWMELFGRDSGVSESTFQEMAQLPQPPLIDANSIIDWNRPVPEQISTVVNNFSLNLLSTIERQLIPMQSFYDGTSDIDFLSRFPVVADDGALRRSNHTRSYDNYIDSRIAYELWNEFRKSGYGAWAEIANKFQGHSAAQVERFCLSLILLCFRALSPTQMTLFPLIVKNLSRDISGFSYDMVLCSRKGKWIHAVSEDHELNIEVNACKPLKETIYDSGFDYLTIIEIKLTAKLWLSFNNKLTFDFTRVPPTYTKGDREIFESIVTPYGEIDPYDDRIQAMVDVMKEDIIGGARLFSAQQFDFWSGPEFQAVIQMMSNYNYSFDDPIGIHKKTGLLSKTTEQVVVFVNSLHNIVTKPQKKFPVTFGLSMTLFDHSPEELQSCKGSGSWTQMQKNEYSELNERISAIKILQKRLSRLEPFPETTTWSNYHTRILFDALIKFGLDQMKTILLDKKIGLVRMLNKHDKRFVEGKLKQRIREPNAPPDFVLTEEALIKFLRNEDSDQYFEKLKYQNYTYIPQEQHYEYNWEDSEEESSGAELFVDDYDDNITARRMRRIDDDDIPFSTHLLESDD